MTETATTPAPPIDPLAPTAAGQWTHGHVQVRRTQRLGRARALEGAVATGHFVLCRHPHRLTVLHDLEAAAVSNDLTTVIAEELIAPGLLRGQAEFESVLTGVVRSAVPGALAAWARFYGNSLRSLVSGRAPFAPIHTHAKALLRGRSLIDIGACFGFFSIRMAAEGVEVTAVDCAAGTMRLLEQVSTLMCPRVRTVTSDAGHVPLPDAHADTVAVLHLLEHLRPEHARTVLEESLRLARRRLIVAVPFEDTPQGCFGHVQCFDMPSLCRMGEALVRRHPGTHYRVQEHHGGWLVIDKN